MLKPSGVVAVRHRTAGTKEFFQPHEQVPFKEADRALERGVVIEGVLEERPESALSKLIPNLLPFQISREGNYTNLNPKSFLAQTLISATFPSILVRDKELDQL